ncbi:hypothetical protein N7510_003074 [Penicillium lagena]|uniref:uncharacterized protein n=1 Tax=Penicillium lagena TaxID=94218 RepID=UPI00253F8322|nr:uncharacterized protein N7510_003074 [Penicillium lagena]KAJ5619090.1 hypothetical protein N7510_003074 [Penicillium lagena]
MLLYKRIFRNVAHTIAHTFPFGNFARTHNCSLPDVTHAISAVVLAPLRRPHLLLKENLSVSEYSQILIAEWRARQQEKRACVTADTPARSQASEGTRDWVDEPDIRPWRSGTPRSPVIRTEVEIDIWGDYIPVEKWQAGHFQ